MSGPESRVALITCAGRGLGQDGDASSEADLITGQVPSPNGLEVMAVV